MILWKNINENNKKSMIHKIEKYLRDLITGKIPVKLKLHEPDSSEKMETFKEDVNIELPDDSGISCEFEWGYKREKGMKSKNRLTPDDPDSLTLNWLNIQSFSYYETEITPLHLGPMFETPELKGLMLEFLSNEIVGNYVDEIGENVDKEINNFKKGETDYITYKENKHNENIFISGSIKETVDEYTKYISNYLTNFLNWVYNTKKNNSELKLYKIEDVVNKYMTEEKPENVSENVLKDFTLWVYEKATNNKHQRESRIMKFDQFVNESKMFIKHFRPEEYEYEIKKLSEWKNQPNHFYTTNDKSKHLEIVLYVSGKPTEKFIFDGDKSNESKIVTADQMVRTFVANVDAGWILKSVLKDKGSIEEQLIEHFDVTYGIENIQVRSPREFRKAVSQLCKLYLKK